MDGGCSIACEDLQRLHSLDSRQSNFRKQWWWWWQSVTAIDGGGVDGDEDEDDEVRAFSYDDQQPSQSNSIIINISRLLQLIDYGLQIW